MQMSQQTMRAHTSETQLGMERSLLSSYSDRKLKTSMSYAEGKSFYRRASKLSPQKLKRFSQISQENLWDPRYLLGCKIPVGVQFDTWPVKPKGHKNKPALLRKLESFVQTEMGFLELSDKGGYNFAKFEVFQRLFEVFIMEFRTYGHLLKTIKDEYETYIEYLQKQASENRICAPSWRYWRGMPRGRGRRFTQRRFWRCRRPRPRWISWCARTRTSGPS